MNSLVKKSFLNRGSRAKALKNEKFEKTGKSKKTTFERTGIDFAKLQAAVKTAFSEKGELIYKPRAAAAALAEARGKECVVARVFTGIPGFDELVAGGVPRNATVMVTGGPGSGKTIFCLQAVVNGAFKYGEPGIYVTFEEDPESLKESCKLFGWLVEELEKKKLLKIIFKDPYEIKDFSKSLGGEIYYTIKDMKAKRIALDSISYLGATTSVEGTSFEVRKTLAMLVKRLKEN